MKVQSNISLMVRVILVCVLLFVGIHSYDIKRINGVDFQNLDVDPEDLDFDSVDFTSDADDDALNAVAVNILQMVRTQHGIPADLVYNSGLKDLAKYCALLYRLQTPNDLPVTHQSKSFDSHCMEVAGGNEIIFHAEVPPTNSLGVANALQAAYNDGEEGYKNYAEPTFNDVDGYSTFTQLLWTDSRNVGCACDSKIHVPKNATIPNNLYICSCIFVPPGNVRHGYSQAGLANYVRNVRPRGSTV